MLSAVLIALLLLTPGTGVLAVGEEDDGAEPVTLFVATDLHYLAPELTDDGEFYRKMVQNGDGKAMEYCEELMDALIEQVIDLHPNALILSGDLTFNGEQLSHIALAEKLQQIEDAGIPVLAIPGNHDLENPRAASFQGDGYSYVDSIDAEQYAEIYAPFGLDDALARDDASLSYVAEVTPSLWALMLDVNADGSGTVTAPTLQWVEQQLQRAAQEGVHVLAVSHQNLLKHNSLFVYGYVIGNRTPLLELYEKYGVICNLSGHIHMQRTSQSDNGLPEIVTSSLMVWPNHYGVLTLEGTQAQYCAVSAAENRPELAEATHSFFWDNAYRQGLDASDGEDAEALARFFADVNTAYFAGQIDQVEWDDGLLQSWKEKKSFLSAYLQTIPDEGFQNHTEYSFAFN